MIVITYSAAWATLRDAGAIEESRYLTLGREFSIFTFLGD